MTVGLEDPFEESPEPYERIPLLVQIASAEKQ
jgi:hypothetical protein